MLEIPFAMTSKPSKPKPIAKKPLPIASLGYFPSIKLINCDRSGKNLKPNNLPMRDLPLRSIAYSPFCTITTPKAAPGKRQG